MHMDAVGKKPHAFREKTPPDPVLWYCGHEQAPMPAEATIPTPAVICGDPRGSPHGRGESGPLLCIVDLCPILRSYTVAARADRFSVSRGPDETKKCAPGFRTDEGTQLSQMAIRGLKRPVGGDVRYG